MIGAEVVRRLFALRAAGPFQRLEDAELLLIARHARPRTFAAGKVVIAAGTVAEALFVAPHGGVEVGGVAAPVVFDAPGLLFGLAARADYVAGPAGLEALVIAKPHVFTIARECPEFVVGLCDLAERAGA
jgi:CRP-like cAMP-binding protein